MSSVPFPISTQSKWLPKANFPEKWKIPLTWVVSTFVPHFKTSPYLFIFPRGRSAPYFCQHVSHALASSSSGPLFNHLLSLAFSNSLSWQLLLSLEIHSGFSPAQKHSLSSATPTSFVLKQRSFTANPSERPTHTHCFFFLSIHTWKPLQPGLWPYHPRKLHAPGSLVFYKAPNP